MSKQKYYRFGEYVLRPARCLLICNGQPIDLPYRLYETLLYLVENHDRNLSKEELLSHVWQGRLVGEDNLMKAISDIRRRLNRLREGSIQTISGLGYRFTAPVMCFPESRIGDTLSPAPSVRGEEFKILGIAPFLVCGMSEEIGFQSAAVLAALIVESARSNVEVVSPAIIRELLQRGCGPSEISGECRLSHLIEGTLRKEASSVQVSLQMTNRQGRIEWAARLRFDQQPDSLPCFMEQTVAPLIWGRFQRPASTAGHHEALELHAKALFHWKNRTFEGLTRGLAYAEKAITRDPRFAQGHVTYAHFLTALLPYAEQKPKELLNKAHTAIYTALEIDPGSSDAYVGLGLIQLLYEFSRAASQASFEQAIALDPANFHAYHWLGNQLASQSQSKEAIEALSKGRQIRPHSLSIRIALAQAYFLGQDYGKSEKHLLEALELLPDFPPALFGLAMNRGQVNDQREALGLMKQAFEQSGGKSFYAASLAWAHSKWGQRKYAQELWKHLRTRRRSRYQSHADVAVAATACGDVRHGLRALERAVADRDSLSIWIGVDPRLEGLRKEAQFADLLSTTCGEPSR